MKKVLISATMLIGMMASAMVFSSFTTSREDAEVLNTQISVQGDWREVGRYKGYNGTKVREFVIWEKAGMCGAYYWMTGSHVYKNPDEASGTKYSGQLRQNSEKQWYAAFDGDIYIIKGF